SGAAALSAGSASSVGDPVAQQQVAALAATAPAASVAPAAAPAASTQIAPPVVASTSSTDATLVETPSAASTSDQLDRALLLLLDGPGLATTAKPVETSFAGGTEDSVQPESAATTDSDALAVAWQSWGAL